MSTTALLVLGMQTGLGYGNETQFNTCVANIYKYTLYLRQYDIPIFFTVLYFYPGFPEVSPSNPTYASVKDAPGFSQPLQLRIITFHGDVVVKTARLDAFIGSTLDMTLRIKGIKKLMFCGYDTEGIILSTVTHASALDYECVVLHDLIVTRSFECHRSLIQNVLPTYTTAIISSFDFANQLLEKYGSPKSITNLPPALQISEIRGTPQSKQKPKAKDTEDFRKAALLNAANLYAEPAEGVSMAREDSSIQEPLQTVSVESRGRRGRRGQIMVSDDEQPATGSLRNTKRQDENEIQIKKEENSDAFGGLSTKPPIDSPTTTRTVRLRQKLEDDHPSEPPKPPTRSASKEREVPTDITEHTTPPSSPRPKNSSLRSSSILNSVNMVNPAAYILSREPHIRDRARVGLEQVRRQTQDEFFNTPIGKRDYNMTFLSWQPITHKSVISGPLVGSPADERLFKPSQHPEDNGEPLPKRRKSDEAESQDEQVKDEQLAFRPQPAEDGKSMEMQTPDEFLASSLKEKMKFGGLKSHLPTVLDQNQPESKRPERFQGRAPRENAIAGPSELSKTAIEANGQNRLSRLASEDV